MEGKSRQYLTLKKLIMSLPENASRRKFLKTSAQAGLLATAGSLTGLSFLESCSSTKKAAATPGGAGFSTPFTQQDLPYSFNALEPYIDARTMEIHFSRHAAAYAKALKEAADAEGVDSTRPVEDVLARVSKYSAKMRNNAGGHYNHELFWKCMKRTGQSRPTGRLLSAIETGFKSFEDFKTQFADAGKNRFGSGWAWLYLDSQKKLKIGSTPNQDNPLMDVAEVRDVRGIPLLGLDVWEHAYYLKYQNRRPDYIESWWNVVNWDYVQQRFEKVF
jgi:superoxide dismutase, Fe-Mn family